MALQVNFDHNGYEFENAYVNATVGRVDKVQTLVFVNMWPSEADRTANKPALNSIVEVVPTNLSETSDNPIEYAYKLLKTLPKYASATDV